MLEIKGKISTVICYANGIEEEASYLLKAIVFSTLS